MSATIAFRDLGAAGGRLGSLQAALPAPVGERLRLLLRSAADPDAVVLYLQRLSDAQPGAFQRMLRSPVALQFLVTVFSYSRFLSEEVVKHPEWLEPLPHSGDLHRVRSAEQYQERLSARLAGSGGDEIAGELASFRREQLLRILLRDVLSYGALADITEELSNLADAIIECACERLRLQLESRHGVPRSPGGSPSAFAVLALGKMGGRELNYSSDIDLMFLYEANGDTDGRNPITNKEFFKKLAVQLTGVLSQHTPHGLCYRVDLRLRPEGTLGELCVSLDGARAYYNNRARDWELQMLIKARAAAGSRPLGRRFFDIVEPLIYTTTLDFSKVEAVSEARIRIQEKNARRRGNLSELDIKLASGGIRDIEFLVQCLQRLHGGRDPWLRHGGTLLALFRLWDKKLLTEIEYGKLASAYRFFREVEHRLQVLDDLQTHTIPSDPDDRELLARRLPSPQLGNEPTADRLMAEIERHQESVREIYQRVVHTQLPAYYTPELPDADEVPARQTIPEDLATPDPADPMPVNLLRQLTLTTPSLADAVRRTRLGRKAFCVFLERILPHPEWMEWLAADPVLTGYVVDIFDHSPYFAELLNRRTALIEELYDMRLHSGAPRGFSPLAGDVKDPAQLRQSFHREMLRIQAESICLRTPIFETLKRTSALADSALGAVYQLAVNDVTESRPPEAPGYEPRDQLMVIALGRLGMEEFDLGSDADVIFAIPDQDSPEIAFWTRVAERMISLLTSITADGKVFAVDTRLRPNGSAGPLVQTESAYHDYFSRSAEAWEGIAYMKARTVAGNLAAGTAFLSKLQDVDFRRYGQVGRSRSQLRDMRIRLEQEQGPRNPLKAGPGGYYDIDFAMMYLRLKSAGIFFPVLNTPSRVDVIEKMGHLDPHDANFLLDAATFYRAVDHALRLVNGQAQGTLPSAQLQLDMISELVSRWTPAHLHDQPLPIELVQIQTRTREYFDRLFAAS